MGINFKKGLKGTVSCQAGSCISNIGQYGVLWERSYRRHLEIAGHTKPYGTVTLYRGQNPYYIFTRGAQTVLSK